MSARARLPLWRVTGTGRRGGNCCCNVRAATYADALDAAVRYGMVTLESCVQIEQGGEA